MGVREREIELESDGETEGERERIGSGNYPTRLLLQTICYQEVDIK